MRARKVLLRRCYLFFSLADKKPDVGGLGKELSREWKQEEQRLLGRNKISIWKDIKETSVSRA